MEAIQSNDRNRGPNRLPTYSESSIRVSLELEGLKKGSAVSVTPDGAVSNAPGDGITISRSPDLKGWSIKNNSTLQVDLLPRSGPPHSLTQGAASNLKSHEQVRSGSLQFMLPGTPLRLVDPSLVPSGPIVQPRPEQAPKGVIPICINSLFIGTQLIASGATKIAPERLQNLSKLIQALPGFSAEDAQHIISTPNRFESAVKMLSNAAKALGVDLDRSEEICVDPSYEGALRAIRELTGQSSYSNEGIKCPFMMTPDPAAHTPELNRLHRHVDRETSVLLATLVGLALRDHLGDKVISKTLKNHPDRSNIEPETDVVLFLRELGMPLSPFFFGLDRVRSNNGGSMPRLRALEILKDPAPRQTES